MKKYIYVGILIGAIALAGCSLNEESAKVTEDISNRQTVEVVALSDADIEKVVPVTPLELTQEQKEDHHMQYYEIVEDLKAEYQFSDMALVPLDEFLEEDWVEPEEFKGKLVSFLENGAFYAN